MSLLKNKYQSIFLYKNLFISFSISLYFFSLVEKIFLKENLVLTIKISLEIK